MIKTLKNFILPILILFFIGFLTIVINQISSLYLLAQTIDPLFGKIVLYGLIMIFSVLFLTPFYIIFRMPKSVANPETEEDIPAFQQKLLKRLSKNPILKKEGLIPKEEEDLTSAMKALDVNADDIIKKTAGIVFLTTSVSQNGKLDALTVLIAQLRMVWKIAHIYNQRPSIKDLAKLYVNVGASAFLASEIEDIDISKQIEPVVTSLFRNASGKSIPLLGPTASLIFDSILEGSTNAFLTLRVGIISKKLCGNLGVVDKKIIKREAIKEAAIHLRTITLNSSGKIIAGFIKVSKNAGKEILRSGWDGLKNAGSKVKGEIIEKSQKMNPFKTKTKESIN